VRGFELAGFIALFGQLCCLTSSVISALTLTT